MGLLAPIRRITETFRDRITAPFRRELSEERASRALIEETVADLERQLNDPDWIRFTALAQQEFSPEGMQQLRAICRLYTIKNPMLKRGAALRSAYVWGQGVEITARAGGQDPGEQDVQSVVDAFLRDPSNQRVLTGAQAQNQLEHALFADGDVFLACFTAPRTGRVQVRTIPADDIVDIICNPEDASEPWFYHRRWVETSYDTDGNPTSKQRELLYPCIDFRPRARPRVYAKIKVEWSAPVHHVAVNRPLGWKRGIPDAYAAVDWARAYKTFLEDWATLMKSLSRFAWRLTSKGSARAQARAALAAPPPIDPDTGEAHRAGATAVTPLDAVLEAIPKSGATIDADSGRPLASMVAAALGIPVTMLLGDPGTTGARATAETLDQPTELEMSQRRELWTVALQRVLAYVIMQAVRAPSGPLRGTITRDPYTTLETVTLAGDTSTAIDITWPDLDDVEPGAVVEAVVKAASTQTMPPEQTLRLLLTALGVRDVDDLVDTMLDPETGEFQWPAGPSFGLGDEAAFLARSGGDPTDAGPGPMDDDEDDTEEDDPSDEEDEDEGRGP